MIALAVAPKHSASFHPGAAARFHVGWRITDQQTIFRACTQDF